MNKELEAARKELEEARDRYKRLRQEQGADKGPPSFSDCAALHSRAALAYRVASALASMGMFDEAAAYAGEGDILAAVADACSEAASG